MGKRSWNKGGKFVPTDKRKRRKAELEGYRTKTAEAKKELARLIEHKKAVEKEYAKNLRAQKLKQRQDERSCAKQYQERNEKLTKKEELFAQEKENFHKEWLEIEEGFRQHDSSIRSQEESLARRDQVLKDLTAKYRKKLSDVIEKEKIWSAEKIDLTEQKRLVDKKISFNQELEKSLDRKKVTAEETLLKLDIEKESLFKKIQELKDLRQIHKKALASLEKKKTELAKREEALEERKKTVDADAKTNAEWKEKLDEQEAYQNDVERDQSIRNRDLDKKIKLIKKLRKEQKGGK